MSTQSRRLPLQAQIADAAVSKAQEVLETHGLGLPCKIVQVLGALVKVEFLLAGVSLPQLTIPLATCLYDRPPYQFGDLGVAISLNASPAFISGQNDQQTQLNATGNLGSLVFFPVASTKWDAVPDPNMYLVQGPNGFIVRSIDGSVSITGTKGKSLVMAYGGNELTLDSGGASLNCALRVAGDITSDGTITGKSDVIAGGISGKSHTHNVTAVGSPTSTPNG